MNVTDAVVSRCSVRRFLDRPIDGFLGVPSELMLFTDTLVGWADPPAPGNQVFAPWSADTIHFHRKCAVTNGVEEGA